MRYIHRESRPDGPIAAEAVGGLARLAAAWPAAVFAPPKNVTELCAALDEFTECVRYLNTRRSEGAILTLDSEAAVQDALPDPPTLGSGSRARIAE